jgi:hypothetical protein
MEKYHLYTKTIDFLLSVRYNNNNDMFANILYDMSNSDKYKDIKYSIFIIYQNYENRCANFSKRNIEVQIENILLREIGIIFCKEIIGAN